MKLQLILPALAVVALAACSKEEAPASVATTPATAPSATAPESEVVQTEGLSKLPDQLSAEEIQARREAWVSGGASSDSRVAATPRPTRE
jgi:uncharacterized lipoprotein